MKIVKALLVLVVAIAFVSCDGNRVYVKHQKGFPNYDWDKEKQIVFTPEIVDTSSNYKIYIALRHIFGFQFRNMKAKMETNVECGLHCQ